jgi:hypothetical protein
MAINYSYPDIGSLTSSDRLLVIDTSNNNSTKTTNIGSIVSVAKANISLQDVLDVNNTATQNINLTGQIVSTSLTTQNAFILNDLNVDSDLEVDGFSNFNEAGFNGNVEFFNPVIFQDNILVPEIQFANPATSGEKLLKWNNTDGTLDLGLKGGNFTLQIGQEQVIRVVNGTGAELLEAQYRAVKVIGAQGQRLQVGLAQANSNVNSATTIGLVTETIANNQEGFITTEGTINKVNTTGSLQGETWSDGDVLYLSATIPGALTNVKPVTPNPYNTIARVIVVGFVEYAHASNGKIYVKVDNGYELEDLHDVNINNPLGNELLAYNAITGFWRNVDIKEIGGVTTASPGVSNYVTKFNSSSTISPSTLIFDNGTGVGIGTTTINEIFNVEGKLALNNAVNSISIGEVTGGTGNQCIAIGSSALSLGAGVNNIAVGFRAMQGSTTANANVVIGVEAMQANTTGNENSVIGYRAMQANTTGIRNVAIGIEALKSNASGIRNIAIGHQSLFSNNLKDDNVAVGYQSLFSNTTGENNTAIGTETLLFNTTGNNNTSAGYRALYSNTTGLSNTAYGSEALLLNATGNFNTASGYRALTNNTIGSSNTANGHSALASNTTGSSNTANGYAALASNTTGSSNTANGYFALISNTTGSYNVASGYEALLSSTTAEGNVAIGFWSLRSNITGAQNVANGYQSLYSNTTGNNNVAVGYQALRFNTTGSNNVVTGTQSLYNNTTGDSNVSNGIQSLYSNTTGNFNTANGNAALYSNTTGNNNTANGSSALRLNATGNFNTANGSSALYFNTTGSYNTANGYAALFANTTGSYNAVNGYQALFSNTSGNYNIAIGNWALRRNITGSNNVAVGDEAGATVFGGATNITPENSVFIGKGTKSGTNNDTNQIVIGYNAIGDGSNTARIGNTSTTALYVGGAAAGVVLKSPNGTAYKITVDNNGLLVTTLA